MRHLLAAALVLAPLAAPAEFGTTAEPYFDSTRIDMTYGVYCEVRTVGSVAAPDTAAGQIDLLEEVPEFLWDTNLVPAYPGMSFGVRTDDIRDRGIPNVTIKLTHPPFPGSGITEQIYITDISADGPSINAYTFDFAYELVTGTWTFEASDAFGVLYRVSFEVVPAEQLPGVAGNCTGDLLS